MAGSTQKRVRLLVDEIRAQGGTDVTVEINRHCKFRFVNPQGVPCLLIASVSPSDGNADRANVRLLRRLMLDRKTSH